MTCALCGHLLTAHCAPAGPCLACTPPDPHRYQPEEDE